MRDILSFMDYANYLGKLEVQRMLMVFFPFLTFLSCKYLLLKMKNELTTRPAQK